MKTFSLNCQGLGNAPTVLALSGVRKRCDPEVMFFVGDTP
jgi:hypothetical protein